MNACDIIFSGVIALFAGIFGSGTTMMLPPTPAPTLGPAPTSRSFRMGFTPWQYEATVAARDTTYQRIHSHADIIKQHLSDGIPYQEALDGTAYHPDVENEINTRLTRTQSGMTVLLAIDSLSGGRDGKPLYWSAGGANALTEPWLSRPWSSPEVTTAYINFALDMIGRFQPAYFEYGTEVSELILNDLAAYNNEYVPFAQAVYTSIKAQHPTLPLLTTIAMKHPTSPEASLIATHYPSILPYTDVVGVSVYPYIFFTHANKGDPSTLPSDWLSQITAVAGGKPIAVSETGWAAQDTVIPSFSVNEPSNAQNQNSFADILLTEANTLGAIFVIWWTVTDFDALWSNTLGADPVARIWRDIGLYDEDQNARPALTTWDQWLAAPLA